MKKIFLPILTFCLLVTVGFTLPEKKSIVTDLAGLFQESEVTLLESKLKLHKKNYSIDVYILTVDSIEPNYINLVDYGDAIFDKWKLGGKDKKGILLLFSKSLRGTRIVVGNGLWDKIAKSDIKDIIDNSMTPYFKKKQYYQGFNKGVYMVLKFLENN